MKRVEEKRDLRGGCWKAIDFEELGDELMNNEELRGYGVGTILTLECSALAQYQRIFASPLLPTARRGE